jgi:dTDP-4-dehydrorhamnose 3,5-epimerase
VAVPFEFQNLDLPGLILIHARAFEDERGAFMEIYRQSEFAAAGIRERFVQSNLSRSNRSVLRGLHYQEAPWGQGKLVQVLEGEVYDVVADVEPGSSGFGRWVACGMSAANGRILYVPPQYAHGFCVLSESAVVLYHVTAEYNPEAERGILWSDPTLAIKWPVAAPVVSAKDQVWPTLESLGQGSQP